MSVVFAQIDWIITVADAGIPPGGYGDFGLNTLPDTPTCYDYVLCGDNNWDFHPTSGHNGNTVLPVPAPEPTSLASQSCLLPMAAGA